MRLVMVDAEEWFLQGKGDGLRGLESNQQRGGQSGSLGGGDGVKLVRLHPRLCSAACVTGIRFRKCSRAASSGTTPPYSACNLICEEMTLERTSPLRTTAALVSSHEVSMANKVMGLEFKLQLARFNGIAGSRLKLELQRFTSPRLFRGWKGGCKAKYPSTNPRRG